MSEIRIDPSFVQSLKQSVKNEMLRRRAGGSLGSYAVAAYDFTVTPTVGGWIAPEHYQKIFGPLEALNSDVFHHNAPTLENLEQVADLVAEMASKNIKASSLAETGCKTQCTGLCYNGCSDQNQRGPSNITPSICIGGVCGGNVCSHECDATCSQSNMNHPSCNQICSSGCSGCYGNCSNQCYNGCSDSCLSTSK